MDLNYKFVLLGEGRCGKTSILLRYIKGEFSPRQISTLQASYLEKCIKPHSRLEGHSVMLSVWDTAGQERFHALGPIYYREAVAAILVYDITCNESFEKVKRWVRELRCIVGNVCIALVGNKSDLEKYRKVNAEDVQNFADSIEALNYMVSAKDNVGIDEVFSELVFKVYETQPKSVIQKGGRRMKLVIIDEPMTSRETCPCHICNVELSDGCLQSLCGNRKYWCSKCQACCCSKHCRNISTIACSTFVRVCDCCLGDPAALFQKAKTKSSVNTLDSMEASLAYFACSESLDIRKANVKRTHLSVVHKALFKQTGQVVAVKAYNYLLKSDRTELEREKDFLVRIAEKPHRYILSDILLQSFGNEEFPYIVLPFEELGTLHEYMSREPRSSVAFNVRMRVLLQVCQALHHLESMEIMHNDVRAGNVLVSRTLNTQECLVGDQVLIKLFDFTHARSSKSEMPSKFWQPSLYHCAPEVWEGKEYSTPAEMYSFAVLIAEVLGDCRRDIFDEYPRFMVDILDKLVRENLRPTLPKTTDGAEKELIEHLKNLAIQGWNREPSQRPNFVRVAAELSTIPQEATIYVKVRKYFKKINLRTASSGATGRLHDSELKHCIQDDDIDYSQSLSAKLLPEVSQNGKEQVTVDPNSLIERYDVLMGPANRTVSTIIRTYCTDERLESCTSTTVSANFGVSVAHSLVQIGVDKTWSTIASKTTTEQVQCSIEPGFQLRVTQKVLEGEATISTRTFLSLLGLKKRNIRKEKFFIKSNRGLVYEAVSLTGDTVSTLNVSKGNHL